MSAIRIDISELKNEGNELIKELEDFLKEKTGGEIAVSANEVTVSHEEEPLSRKHIRVLLRRFLHKTDLRDYYKIIGGKEDALIVKEIKVSEE